MPFNKHFRVGGGKGEGAFKTSLGQMDYSIDPYTINKYRAQWHDCERLKNK